MRCSRLCCVLLCFAALLPVGANAGDKSLPPELGLVAPDGLAFIHVRLADIWKSEHFREWRTTVLKAGQAALAAFDARFFPSPSSLERVTIFVPSPKQKDADPKPIIIIATSKPIDKEGFKRNTVPGATEKKTAAGTLLVDARKRTEIYFPDGETMVVGPAGAVEDFLSQPRKATGNLTEALRLTGSKKALVWAFNPERLPPRALEEVPATFRPLLQGKLLVGTIDLDQGRIDVRAAYAGAEEATNAEKAAQEAIQLARLFLAKGRSELEKKVTGDNKAASLEELPEAAASLFALGLLNRVEEFLDSSPIKKEGNALHASLKLPQGGAAVLSMAAMGSALLVPAVQKVREAASRTQGTNNLKQIGLAMHNWHAVYKTFPAAAICDKQGKPLLSWRVAILPFVEEEKLWKQFKMDEPWDSEHNRKLIPLMPQVYMVPASPTKRGETHYRVFVGGGAGFEWARGIRLIDIRDGTSNTLMVVEAADSVPWTKPDELVYDPKKPLPRMADFYHNGTFAAALFDGSVRMLRSNLPEQTLRALITRSGGEVVPPLE
jgi:hypothetical protein